jgi:hypothetical protein
VNLPYATHGVQTLWMITIINLIHIHRMLITYYDATGQVSKLISESRSVIWIDFKPGHTSRTPHTEPSRWPFEHTRQPFTRRKDSQTVPTAPIGGPHKGSRSTGPTGHHIKRDRVHSETPPQLGYIGVLGPINPACDQYCSNLLKPGQQQTVLNQQ